MLKQKDQEVQEQQHNANNCFETLNLLPFYTDLMELVYKSLFNAQKDRCAF